MQRAIESPPTQLPVNQAAGLAVNAAQTLTVLPAQVRRTTPVLAAEL
jgi:hypothetical protein